MPTQDKMKQWSIIGALVLPVLLILAVWLSNLVPAKLVPPPQYDFIYAVRDSLYQSSYLNVVDNQLRLNFYKLRDQDFKPEPYPRLYRYKVATDTVELIPFEVTQKIVPELGKWRSVPVRAPLIQGYIPGSIAPDNYQYERRAGSSHWYGFFRSSYYVNHVFHKDKNSMVFFRDKARVDFIGWI